MGNSKKYELSLISYFDILGFKNLVREKSAADIHQILRLFQHESEYYHADLRQCHHRFTFFSDTVLRTTNLLSRSNLRRQSGELFLELLSLTYTIGTLIQRGIFIRGALTVGPIFHMKDLFFGPGLVSAYELEQKAIFPRIIIDPQLVGLVDSIDASGTSSAPPSGQKLLTLLFSNHNDSVWEQGEIRSFIQSDADGVSFLDYLPIFTSEVESGEGAGLEFLRLHRRMIVENISRYSGDQRVLAKYQWLADYHNSSLARIPLKSRMKRELTIAP